MLCFGGCPWSLWLWDIWMGFREIWVSLVTCNSDEHKLIWAYLGLVFGKALLVGDVDIYLYFIFLFIFRILRTTWFCFVLDWSELQSIQNSWPEIHCLPVAISHFWDHVLCVEKCEATNLFEAGYISFLQLIYGVPTLKCIQFGSCTCSVMPVLVSDVVLPGRCCSLVAHRATYVVDGQFFSHLFWKVEGTVRTHVNSRVAHVWLPYMVINMWGELWASENSESLENLNF